jgi:exonuclease VII small subunit
MEKPIQDEIEKLQQIKGYVVPDLSVLRGMINSIEAKRQELRRALNDTERQTKARSLCMQRVERIEQTVQKITQITELLYPRYAIETSVSFLNKLLFYIF